MSDKRPQTIMVIDNNFERRVYHSMDGAAKGLGWGFAPNHGKPGSDLLIYRLDEEATATANAQLVHLLPHHTNILTFIKGGVMDWKAHKAAAIAILKGFWR